MPEDDESDDEKETREKDWSDLSAKVDTPMCRLHISQRSDIAKFEFSEAHCMTTWPLLSNRKTTPLAHSSWVRISTASWRGSRPFSKMRRSS